MKSTDSLLPDSRPSPLSRSFPTAAAPVEVAEQSDPRAREGPASRSNWLPYAFALWSFVSSMLLLPYYWGGDQLFYRAFYDSAQGASIVDAYSDFGFMLASNEPGYFLLVWLASPWIEKDLLMSVLNAVFGFYLARGLAAFNPSPIVMGLLAINYYLLMLYLTGERLKLAILFLLISTVHSNKTRYVTIVLALLSHVQTVLLIVGRLMASLIPSLMPLVRGKIRTQLLWAPAALCIVALPLLGLEEHLRAKLEFYMLGEQGLVSLVKPVVFVASTFVYAPGRRAEALAMHLPVLAGAALVGPDRLALFSYFIFMYFGLQVRRGLNWGVLLSSVYFAVTGLVFMFDVVNYGTGFQWSGSALFRLLL